MIAYLYMNGRLARLAAARRGELPTEFFYGAIELERQGMEVAHLQFDPAFEGGLAAGAVNLLRPWFPPKLDASSVSQAWHTRPLLEHCEAVVATAGSIARNRRVVVSMARSPTSMAIHVRPVRVATTAAVPEPQQ